MVTMRTHPIAYSGGPEGCAQQELSAERSLTTPLCQI